jgi:hypothetical protein
MNSLRPLILITPAYITPCFIPRLLWTCYGHVMDTYFVSYELSCNYTKVINKGLLRRDEGRGSISLFIIDSKNEIKNSNF